MAVCIKVVQGRREREGERRERGMEGGRKRELGAFDRQGRCLECEWTWTGLPDPLASFRHMKPGGRQEAGGTF